MLLFYLLQSPMLFIGWVAAIILAISVHEFSHAFVAHLQGDNTARDLGRLTINPLAHIDPLGFIMLLMVGFGWGKPVPFNPYNLKYQKWGPAFIFLAGPISNLITFIVFAVILNLVNQFFTLGPDNLLIIFLSLVLLINVVLMVFNLIPIPPLDGSKVLFVLLPQKYNNFKVFLETRGPYLLILFIIIDRMIISRILGVSILEIFFTFVFSFLVDKFNVIIPF